MQNNENRICSLCRNLPKKEFEAVQELTQETFGEIFSCLLLNFDSTTNKKRVACESCIEDLNKCFSFKAECLFTEERVASFSKDNKLKLDLREVYLSEITNGDMDSLNDHIVCRLCMNLMKCGKNLRTEAEDMMILLEKYFPEMDLNTTKEFITCTLCYDSLQHYFTFMDNCLTVENRITGYSKVENIDNKIQIKLYDILHFTPDMLKEGEEEDTNGEVKIEDIKIEAQELGVDKEYTIKDEKNDRESFQGTGLLPSSNIKSEVAFSSCEICTPQTSCEKCLNLNQEKASKTSEFKCAQEKVSKTSEFKCDLCTYRSKCKDDLCAHKLTHDPEAKSASDVTYACHLCIFQTNYRNNLTRHMLLHRRTSEVKIYKCHICEFTTSQKRYLPTHLRSHRSKAEKMSEATTIKCDICSFQTNRKDTLVQHMLLHKNTSDITLYECNRCDFQSKHKKNLRQHMLTHKPVSDVKMYKCHMCKFESKYNRCLTRHVLRHFKKGRRKTVKSEEITDT